MTVLQQQRVRDLGRVVTGKTPPTEQAEYFEGDELFVSPKDLSRDSYYVEATETRISEKALEKFGGQVIPRDSVMFTSLSFAFGKMGLASKRCMTNQQITSVVVNDEHIAKFVYYLLRVYEPFIYSYNSGIDTPIVPKSVFENIPIQVPKRNTQRKIAAILSAYDDLIAHNQRRIALLESMAEEIYREWFVRMRFPGREANEFDGLLPQGWARRPLGELTKLIKRGISPDYSDQGEGIVLNQKCIRDGKVNLADSRRHQTQVSDEKHVQIGDVLINSTGVGTLGRVAVYNLEVERVTCDSHVTILRPDERKVTPTYLGATVAFLQGYFESMASGSTGQSELSRELIARTKVLVPSGKLQQQFAEMVTAMMRQRRMLQDSNGVLSSTRDALLPRLISGKLKIDHLDIQLPPSMRAETEAA